MRSHHLETKLRPLLKIELENLIDYDEDLKNLGRPNLY